MLATLRIPALLLGLGAGALAATLVSLIAEFAYQAIVDSGESGAGLVPGIVVGFLVGGYVAGHLAIVANRFHGSVTGLALSGLVVFIARGGGSPATLGPVLFLAVIGMILGGVAGSVAGRRRARGRKTSHSG